MIVSIWTTNFKIVLYRWLFHFAATLQMMKTTKSYFGSFPKLTKTYFGSFPELTKTYFKDSAPGIFDIFLNGDQ